MNTHCGGYVETGNKLGQEIEYCKKTLDMSLPTGLAKASDDMGV